ncbi:MAG: sigma-70 family RNA polymerase sigma factor [Byssovorax sp.]
MIQAIGPPGGPHDPSLLRELYKRLHGVVQYRVGRVAARWAPSAAERRQELEDLIQIVFEHLFVDDFRVLRTWNPDLPGAASLENYVGLIAERKANEVLRGGKNPWKNLLMDLAAFVELPSCAPSSEAEYAGKELAEAIRNELKRRVSSKMYRIFQLVFEQGLSIEEVCRLEQMTRGAVDQQLNRLRDIIRQILGDLGYDLPKPKPKPR